MESGKTLLNWQVGWTNSPTQAPERFVPAIVPGAVQLDWARAEGWAPYWIAENFRAYAWMEDVHWVYRARLSKPSLASDQQLVLFCGGVDYACSVRIDGQIVCTHEGMFSTFEIDLTDACNGALIEIILAPAPKFPVPVDAQAHANDQPRKESRQSCKPAVSYGWDFHPRLIPLGIWDETHLQIRTRQAWLDHVEISYELTDDFSSAELKLITHGDAKRVRWTLRDPAGAIVNICEGAVDKLKMQLLQPQLWWPNTEGTPSLYTSLVETLDSSGKTAQTITQRVGLRRIKLVMSQGQFDRDGSCPVTQPAVPITFEVNGRSIFARGANWVCPEIFPGTITPDRYREQLSLFAGAHLNLLRSWGGAIVNKTAFFEQCDELGIMVWQEFPLACNCYEGSPNYLRVLDQESRAIIRRRRRHACIALWCGGNELFNSWSGMTMQDHALRLLDRNCFDLDPTRPFLPTSPLYGIRHGDYRFKMGQGPDAPTVFDVYPSHSATAYVEFGVPAPASVAMLRQIIPANQVWPIQPTSSWKSHHAFGSWHSGEPNSWLYPEVSEHYFGPSDSLEQLVDRLQLLQSEGYKAIYEEGRRQKPICSAVACWVFNEPWPTAANNSLIGWPNERKPGYYAVKAANRPQMISARILRFAWQRDSEFTVTLFLLNDSQAIIEPLKVNVYLEFPNDRKLELGTWECPGAQANRHTQGPTLRSRLPNFTGAMFSLVVKAIGRPDLESSYKLVFTR